MSGMKRTIEDKDPDYEDISIVHENKRHKAIETNARDAAVSKIESIVKEQFAVELKNKEHEIEVIDQRLSEARRMMDKLRAYIVANYYASAGISKGQEGTSACDSTILNHPSIKKFLESPSRASSPAYHRSETPSANNSETDSVCAHNDLIDKDSLSNVRTVQKGTPMSEKQGKDSISTESKDNQIAGFSGSEDTSRRYVKKTIIVGNVSKYIPPDKREENDQSTHKWMVYVRGSRREPSIDHFVKKVWFFLHPSYKPNDLVEVREPPFHLTRRGWGEFPVRVQIHFKDSQNKRIDIIHNLKLDRTYTGLQTLGAETVVEVELLRHSLGEDFLYSQSSNESSQSDGCTPGLASVKSSPHKAAHELNEKGSSMASENTFYTQPSSLERTPTKITQRFTIGAHGSTAFQPITASCKIVPQGQATCLAESPGKSFQPITMSCKIVSGSPTSKHSNISQAGTRSPLPKVHGSSFISQNIKQEESLFAAMPPLCPIGSHSKSQSPKTVAGGLGAFTKVIIKQEPIDASQQQTEMPSTSQASLQQIVTMKGNQMIAVSPQKNLSTIDGPKVVGIPVGSASSIKPSVTISGGQILVAKSSSSATKAVGAKQMVAQGVAKAVVSSGSPSVLPQASQNIAKAQAASAATSKTGSQGSVMATLQLPSSNIGNLANLPPGTKLYLTTNSKSTSGKGKLLLIPQGAILRAASTANLQSGVSASGSSGSASAPAGLPQHLTYTSYILKQTPQGTFLVGQPSPQASGKQGTSNVVVPGSVGSSAQGQQALKVSAGQKNAPISQANSSAGLVKISENVLKSLPATSQTQKPGTTLLRVAGGVITASNTSLPSLSGNGGAQQAAEGSSASVSHTASSSKVHIQQPSAAPSTSHIKLLSNSKSGMLPVPVLSSRSTLSPAPSTSALTVKAESDPSTLSFQTGSAAVKMEESLYLEPSSVKTEHLQNFKQLLTATVKKVPLIGKRDEDGSNLFCASSLEQYYSWNIGKRRASEWQRAVTMKKMLQEIIEKQPKFSNVTPLTTREFVHWCRIHGYTPPDPENSVNDQESIEDVLTRIDNEAALPTSYSSSEALCRKVEGLERFLKKEREMDEDVDIVSIDEELKPQIKKENEDEDDDKFYLTPSLPCEFIRDTAQEIGVSLQPVEVEKNVYASPVEEMVMKATQQFVSDLLRDSLAVAYQVTSRKRAPSEITIANIHQAICNIPLFDFLTNKNMGALRMDEDLPLK